MTTSRRMEESVKGLTVDFIDAENPPKIKSPGLVKRTAEVYNFRFFQKKSFIRAIARGEAPQVVRLKVPEGEAMPFFF